TLRPARSGFPALFFDRLLPTASAANPFPGGSRLDTLDLIASATNGVATQPCNFNQPLDVAVLCSSSQQARKAAATFFVERRQQAIDCSMFFGRLAVWMLTADSALTLMKRSQLDFILSPGLKQYRTLCFQCLYSVE